MTALIRHGRWTYKVKRINADGSYTVFGPVDNDPNGRRSIRTFRADMVSVVAANHSEVSA